MSYFKTIVFPPKKNFKEPLSTINSETQYPLYCWARSSFVKKEKELQVNFCCPFSYPSNDGTHLIFIWPSDIGFEKIPNFVRWLKNISPFGEIHTCIWAENEGGEIFITKRGIVDEESIVVIRPQNQLLEDQVSCELTHKTYKLT